MGVAATLRERDPPVPKGEEHRLRMLARPGTAGWRPGSRLSGFLLVVALLASPPRALAISVYDVVKLSQKGYTAEQIIALIDVSDSVFELTAEDLPKLKRVGVSERVIRKMLERPAPEAQPGQADTPARAAQESVERHRHDAGDDRTPPAEKLPQEGKPFASGAAAFLSSHPVTEEGAGRHTHVTVELGGAPLLILRDEAGLASIQVRADQVARRLDEARALDGGEFRAELAVGTDAVVYRSVAGSRALVIASVTGRDADAYQRRSGRRVTPDLLAEYWAALLNDYWSIYVLARPPRRLVGLHEGEALESLYQAVKQAAEGAKAVESAVQQLPRAALQHLERLAAVVPVEFRASGGHEQKSEP